MTDQPVLGSFVSSRSEPRTTERSPILSQRTTAALFGLSAIVVFWVDLPVEAVAQILAKPA
jgi:hypothetical protein